MMRLTRWITSPDWCRFKAQAQREFSVIHFVLHDARDTVAVVVVEGVVAGTAMTGWIMDEDRMLDVKALQDIPIGHKVALADMAVGDTVLKCGIDMGKVVAPVKKGEHALCRTSRPSAGQRRPSPCPPCPSSAKTPCA